MVIGWLLSGMRLPGKYSRDRAGASGTASIRATLLSDVAQGLRSRPPVQVESFPLSAHDAGGGELGSPTSQAEAIANCFVNEIADPGPDLVATVSLLADQLFHAFAIPEIPRVTKEGEIISAEFGPSAQMIVGWAKHVGLDGTLQ